jgi:signal transduction histidine kinase
LSGEAVPDNEIIRFLSKDGHVCFGEVNNVQIDWEGDPATLTFVSDVTDRVKAEQEVNLEKSKSEFYLDLLGHDIGNLMQGISAWIEMARSSNDLDHRVRYFLDQSWHLSERSKRLVKNVLIISNIRDREPHVEILDLAPMIKRTIEVAINSFPDLEVEMLVDEKECERKILAEPLIEEAFYNIIHNAIKFQLDSKPKVKVECIQNNDHLIKIEISDWGPGIPDKQKSSIFKRFKDITGKKSTGIGLALTKELMDRYNGNISVKDNVVRGKVVGAKFILQLPVVE